jgi:hypothetical protein
VKSFQSFIITEAGSGNDKKIARQISDLDNRKEEEIILYGDIRVVARVTRSQKGEYLVGRKGDKGVSYTTPMSAAIAVGKLAMKNEADLSKYIVEKNPHDGKWYVMGHVGRNKWMPVSNGFKDKGKAQKWAKSQSKVDVAAKGEVGGV